MLPDCCHMNDQCLWFRKVYEYSATSDAFCKIKRIANEKKNVSANWGGFDLFCKIKRIANEKKMFLQIGVDLISACARRD
jgi:hypothetical protein